MSDPEPLLDRPATVGELASLGLALVANLGELRAAISLLESGKNQVAIEHLGAAIAHQRDAIRQIRLMSGITEANALLR